MDIVRLNSQNLKDVNRPNQPFAIIGKLKPSFSEGQWSYTEELFESPYSKTYENDDAAFFAEHINSSDKAAYLAYRDGECVGQMVLRADWNGYGFIEDICVAGEARGQGVGTALIQKAAKWSRRKGLSGLALETQDYNLLACRFYAKRGFSIGGINTMFYKNFREPACNEIAIFWYLRF